MHVMHSTRGAILLAVAVVAIEATASEGLAGESRPAGRASSEDPNSPDYRLPRAKRTAGPERDKLIASVKQTLDTFRPAYGKKESGDYFVVGTIDLKNRHAIVDFVIEAGVQETAEFIADFVLGKTLGEIHEWRVFSRAKNAKAAEVLRGKAKAQSIEDQLLAFKLDTRGKKSTDNYFVVGTADLNSSTQHADIRFEVLCGVRTPRTSSSISSSIGPRTTSASGTFSSALRPRPRRPSIAN